MQINQNPIDFALFQWNTGKYEWLPASYATHPVFMNDLTMLPMPAQNKWSGAANASTSIQAISGTSTRTNLALDPAPVMQWSFYVGANAVASSFTQIGDTMFPSGKASRCTWSKAPTDGWNAQKDTRGTITPGQTITASFYARISWNGTARVVINFYDVNGTSLNSYAGGPTAFPMPAGVVVKLNWSNVIVPANAVGIQVFIDNIGALPPDVATLDMSSLLVETSTTVGTYFDGGTPNTYYPDVRFGGGPHA